MLIYAAWTENLYKSNKKSPLLLLQGAENAINLERDKRITHIRFFDGGLPKTILRLRQPD